MDALTFTVICDSCPYRSKWVIYQEALEAALRHRAASKSRRSKKHRVIAQAGGQKQSILYDEIKGHSPTHKRAESSQEACRES